ncbi:MAG: penicillin-binding transpeptidase domain-containing protein, partial [Anaerolineae bacterium]|nr:penicillin-binding transpeptidase domain-containing protein [Anaerolineae bacterium]
MARNSQANRKDEKPPVLPARGPLRRLALFFTAPRLLLLGLALPLVLTIYALRLYRLQVVETEQWIARAHQQRTELVSLPAPRGLIYSRDGEPLVRNVPAFQVVIIPAYLPEDEVQRETELRRLAALLGVPYSSGNPAQPGIRERVDRVLDPNSSAYAPYDPLIVATNVDRTVALIIAQGQEFAFPGVRVDVVSRRQYPYGSLISQLVGYMGAIPAEKAQEYTEKGYDPATDRIGYAGVEMTFESWLRGIPGQRYQETDILGRVVRVLGDEIPPTPGHNVYLTIDLELQRVAQEALQKGMARVNSRRGVAIAMNPQTGEILAMVSLPTYDNNLFAEGISLEEYTRLLEDPHRPLVNHAIADQLPPGS